MLIKASAIGSTARVSRTALVIGLALLVSACSSRLALPQLDEAKSYDNMYLRGVFNWWEADPSYKLTKTGPDTFSVDVQLIADGQPYDFKVADGNWSPGLTCGSTKDDGTIELASRVRLECDDEDVTNLRFTPSNTGTFRFYLDVANNGRPQLYITRIQTD